MRWLVVVVLAGCYAPVAPDGAPCAEGQRCPSGQACNLLDNRCYYTDPPESPRNDGGTDASTVGNPDGGPDGGSPVTVCVPRRLLTGGTDPATQGWVVVGGGNGASV